MEDMTYPLHGYDTEDDEEDDEDEDMDELEGDDPDADRENDEEHHKRPSKHPLHGDTTNCNLQDTSRPTKPPLSLRSPHVTGLGTGKGKGTKGGKGSPRKSPGSPRMPSGGGRSGDRDQVLFTQREILALRLMFSLFDRSGLVSKRAKRERLSQY